MSTGKQRSLRRRVLNKHVIFPLFNAQISRAKDYQPMVITFKLFRILQLTHGLCLNTLLIDFYQFKQIQHRANSSDSVVIKNK